MLRLPARFAAVILPGTDRALAAAAVALAVMALSTAAAALL